MRKKIISLLTAAVMAFAALPVMAENGDEETEEILTVEETAETEPIAEAVPVEVETDELLADPDKEFESELSQMTYAEDESPIINVFGNGIDLLSTSEISTLVSYIKKHGTTSDDYIEISYTTTSGDAIYKSTISYSSSNNTLLFDSTWVQDNVMAMVGFSYSITNDTYTSVLGMVWVYSSSSFTTLLGTYSCISTDFNMKTFDEDTTITFEPYSSGSESVITTLNSQMNLLIQIGAISWDLLCMKAGIYLNEVGFDAYGVSTSTPTPTPTPTPLPDTSGNVLEITGVTVDDSEYTISAALTCPYEMQGKIFTAVYNADGVLVYLDSRSATKSTDITLAKNVNYCTAKVFWWLGTDSLYPMSNYAEFELSEATRLYSINTDYNEERGTVKITENGETVTKAADGAEITIEISANSAYSALPAVVTDTNGDTIEVSNNTFIMPDGDVTITVSFAGVTDSGTLGVNNTLTWTLDDNGTLTISGSGQMEDFSAGGAPWYAYLSDIKIVVIEDGVTRISKNAFYDCSYIKRALIADSVTEIEASAFSGCSGLAIVEYGGSQSDWAEIYIGADNDPLTEATFIYNSSLTDTAQSALDYLQYTQNEDNTITITGCLDDAVSINIPSQIGGLSVITIGENAFDGCDELTTVIIPSSVTSIEASAFTGCDALTSVTIGTGVETIGDSAFSGCTSLTSVTIPDSVASIGTSAFYRCTELTYVSMGSGIKTIGVSAFYNCTALTSVTIPDSVTSIGASAFYGCTALENVKVGGGVKTIGDSAFYGCTSLASAEISDGVKIIGDSMFYGCTSLSSITIPDSTASIGVSAFYGCKGLKSVTIGNGVETIDDSAFYGCTGLTSVTIPDSVTSIGECAFYLCRSLTSIKIPNSITSISRC